VTTWRRVSNTQTLGYRLVVVTNQAGIARGYYTESEVPELTEWMIHKLVEQQIQIARVCYCPYHPVHGIGRYKFDSPDRKPKPGMLLRARADFNLDLKSSVLIGDRLSDMHAAQVAGVGTRILLRSGAVGVAVQEDHFYISDSLDKIRSRFSPSYSGRDALGPPDPLGLYSSSRCVSGCGCLRLRKSRCRLSVQ
jgi:D-glycero-D-manno-heptose 1,7-bisphosphate phosphatase